MTDVALPEGFSFVAEFDPAWDKRAEDPKRGQHYAQFRFAVIGPLGAAEWQLFTGWTVDSALQGPIRVPANHPIPATFTVHVRVAANTPGAHVCGYVGHCGDGGLTFSTDDFYKALVLEGYAGLARLLLDRYREHFDPTVQQ